jgi:hypothetical protein
MPVGNACLLARAKLSQYVSNLRQASAAEKVGTAVKAGYLANVKSTQRNILGNTAQGIADLATKNVAATADYLQSLVQAAVRGGYPGEYRNIASSATPGGARAAAKGIREGTSQMVQILRTGVNPEAIDKKFGQSVSFKNPVLDKATKVVFNFMEAQDKPFYKFAFETSLYSRARLAGIKAGLRGKALSGYIDQALGNPTEDMLLGAHADAAYSTYKNPTVLSEMAADMRRGIKQRAAKAPEGRRIGYNAALIGMDLTIPFTKVASAIANVAVDYSPAGFIKAIASTMDRDPRMQAEIAQRLIKASAGTGLMLWGMKAAANGNATGSFPQDQAERTRWDLEGKGANMVKVGDTWRSITWLGPMAIPFLLGVNLQHAEDAPTIRQKAAIGAGFMGKTLTEMTFLSGVSSIVNALEDPSKAATVAAQIGLPLPSIIPQTAAAVDPTQRQATTVGQKMQAKIPFASKLLPPRLNAFGDTLRRPSGPGALLDVTSPRKATDTDITRELDRLDINPGRIATTVKMDSTKVKRTPEEVNDLTTEFGPVKRAVLEEIITDPSYRTLSDDEKKKTIEAALRDVSGASSEIDKARRSGDKVPRMTPREFITGAETP